MVKKIKLSEGELKQIISESIKRILKETRGRQKGIAIGTTYVPTSVYENVVDNLMSNGKLNEDEAEKLFQMFESVFDNIKIKGRFSWYKYPGDYYNPPEDSCELVEIRNDDEIIGKLNALQIPNEINELIVNAFEEWCESQMGEGYDDSWELYSEEDFMPDPNEYRERGEDYNE